MAWFVINGVAQTDGREIGKAGGRGRDARYWAPPRADPYRRAFPAYGSYLGP